MKLSILWLAIDLSLCGTILGPSALSSQAPGFNGGKLQINSSPHEGANIFINSKPTNQHTNFAFVMSPGTYWVAVTGGPDNLNCGGEGGKAQITSGSTVVLTCTAKGWQ